MLTANREHSTDEVETLKAHEVRYVFRNLARDWPDQSGLAYDPDPTANLAMYSDPLRGLRSRDFSTQIAQGASDPKTGAQDPQVKKSAADDAPSAKPQSTAK